MNTLGKHLIIELYNCDKALSDDLQFVEKVMRKAAVISGATIVDAVFHKFSPQGVTGVVVVAESHFSIHTWPEYGYCAIDIFTCGERVKPAAASIYLEKEMKAGSCDTREIPRGKLSSFKIESSTQPMPDS